MISPDSAPAKYKVLFAINRLDVAGAERMLLDQIDAINKNRFTPHLLTIYENPKENFVGKIGAETPYHQLRFSGFFDLTSWRKLFRLLQKERYDAVITNLFDTNIIVRLAAILLRVPIILSYEHSVYAGKKKWQILVDWLLAKGTTKILVSSAQVRDFTSRQEGIAPENFVINYNAAKLVFGGLRDKRNATLQSMGLDPSQIYVTSVGRLIEQKGHTYLIDAAVEVLQKHPEVRFLVFGEGGLRRQLTQKIADAHLEEKFFLKGVKPMEDIVAVTDVFAFPSLWEGFAIALINMMDAGRPIVATRVSGTEEALVDGVSGILVEPKDVAALVSGILDCIEQPERAQLLGQAAQVRSRAFSIDANVKTIEKLITHE